MDLVFVVDMKEEKDEEPQRLRVISNFIESSVAGLGIGEYGNHVGLVGYGYKDAKKEGWNLEE